MQGTDERLAGRVRGRRGYSAASHAHHIAVRWVVAGVALVGCRSIHKTGCTPPAVPEPVRCWTDHALTPCACPCEFILPPDVVLEDCVSEDEAIATALTNSAAFRAVLTQLGMANGDVIQAGLLANPNFQTFIPVSAKQWEWTLFAPIEVLFLRPHRVEMTDLEFQRVANMMVQAGLDLVRDVRVAHANLAIATEQAKLGRETVELRQAIADLTQKRLGRGDISDLEATTARIDALTAQANAALLEQNVRVAQAQLARLMGLPPALGSVCTDSLTPTPQITVEEDALVALALSSRPDYRAADWAVAAAAKRAEISRWLFWRVDAVVDANGKGQKGFEIGPGLRFDIPLFNRNQGGIARARAELLQAMYNRDAIRDQIIQDVRTAAAQLRQAEVGLEILDEQVVPALDEASEISRKAYDAGGVPYFLVLQATGQYVDARTQQLNQLAARKRAFAELERSVGRKLGTGFEAQSIELIQPMAPEPLPPTE